MEKIKLSEKAKWNIEALTPSQLSEVESILRSIEPQIGWDEGTINYIFEYDFEIIKEWLCIE